MTMDSPAGQGQGRGGLQSASVPVLRSRQGLGLDANTEMGPAVYSTKAFYSFKNQPLGLFRRYLKKEGGPSHHSALTLTNSFLGDT